MHLLLSEMRRALHRRVVRVLVLLALVATACVGVVAFVDSAGRSIADLGANGTHPALMADWWRAGTGDGILVIAVFPLLIGGLFGGASVAGAEWRAGTVTTVLTWEPRRVRLHWARTASAFLLATLIALALEVLFLASMLPAVLAHGSEAGTDGAWWASLLAAMVRIALMTGGVAVLGVSLASLGRGTAFALGAAFAWVAVGESIIRGLEPSLERFLLGDNVAIVLTWAQLEDVDFTRSESLAAVTLLVYLGVAAALATITFARRDIAAAT